MAKQAASDAQNPAWRRRKEFRRGEIVTAAVQALEEHGADAMSMIDVARRAGVSEATVYKYFGSRHDVVAEALTCALDPFLTELERNVPLIRTCADRLRYYAAQILHNMVEHPNVHQSRAGPMRWSAEYQPTLEVMIARFRTLLRWILEQGVYQKELRSDIDIIVASDMLVGSMAFLAWRLTFEEMPVERNLDGIAQAQVEQLLSGLVLTKAPDGPDLCERIAQLVDDLERRAVR